MSGMDQIDIFTDLEVVTNPLPYLAYLRSKGPVVRLPTRDIIAVTGYEEGMAVFQDSENFSSVLAFVGPLVPVSFTPADDLTDQIAQLRPSLPGGDTVLTADQQEHRRIKSLLMGVITPKRVKENHEFIEQLADTQIAGFIDKGKLEVQSKYSRPLAIGTVAHLLGVPTEDYDKIVNPIESLPGPIGSDPSDIAQIMDERIRAYFRAYISDRRETPRGDVMSEIANTRYVDGSLPPIEDVVSLAALLFGAGEDTTSRVVTGAIRWLAEDFELQGKLRADPSLIPNLVEEFLRFDGPGLAAWRTVKRAVRIGDVDAKPGTAVMLMLSAMNRDPRRFADPAELKPGRPDSRDHVAFGRGIHACPGAPVARAEVKIAIERILARTSEISIDESVHGPADARRYERLPSYFVQGLDALHINFVKA